MCCRAFTAVTIRWFTFLWRLRKWTITTFALLHPYSATSILSREQKQEALWENALQRKNRYSKTAFPAHPNELCPFYGNHETIQLKVKTKRATTPVVSLKVCNSSFLSLLFHCFFILFFPAFELIYSPAICRLCFLHRHGCQ